MMAEAKQRVKTLFDKVREDINAVLSTMETEWICHIDAVGNDIETAQTNEDVGEAKKRRISNTGGIYDSLVDVLSKRQEAVELDERLKKLEKGTDLPNVNSADLKMAITKVLKDMKLSRDSLIDQQTYVPNILEVLYSAAINNDIKVFKESMENEKLPPNASKFILNYSFPMENWPMGEGFVSDKIPHLAALKGNLDILDYLVDNNFDLDNVDRNGKIVSQYLFATAAGKSTGAEKVHLKLFENEQARNLYPLKFIIHVVLSKNWFNVIKLFVDKYGSDINGLLVNHGATAHQEVTTKRNKVMFDFLMDYSPDLRRVDFDDRNVLHTACLVDFHQVIDILMTKKPELLEVMDNNYETPLEIAIGADHLESFKVLVKYFDINVKAKELLEIARQKNANKILTWINKSIHHHCHHKRKHKQ